jgi:hypothetical protein
VPRVQRWPQTDGNRKQRQSEEKVKQTEVLCRQRGNPSEEGQAMLSLALKSTASVAPKQRNLHQG